MFSLLWSMSKSKLPTIPLYKLYLFIFIPPLISIVFLIWSAIMYFSLDDPSIFTKRCNQTLSIFNIYFCVNKKKIMLLPKLVPTVIPKSTNNNNQVSLPKTTINNIGVDTPNPSNNHNNYNNNNNSSSNHNNHNHNNNYYQKEISQSPASKYITQISSSATTASTTTPIHCTNNDNHHFSGSNNLFSSNNNYQNLVLPNGNRVKVEISDQITFQQLKTLVSQSYKAGAFTVSMSADKNDQSKQLKAVNWTKVLTIDAFKKMHPLGLVSNSEVEFNDGTDGLIVKFYVHAA
ncbi:hypothetical protein PPL_09499 [Heterostelium album PN500]|uniref:Uncharacterized protein n=1 Tax=Heterostelium pallidum (strain ATCC 26659 / Pp 5 / PN500) TaxID=670386 RepID=D3BN88_HETP5|nr:hypothetical protein PPL_09499 [Heterostelium album PN500]EFA76748.1 hypothetical protein PPL_09499 [Heterostelium album PN500]|eukprot:XP_020428880.1 hypothetical protein PPL_09499 [Heterostelium album PN500]